MTVTFLRSQQLAALPFMKLVVDIGPGNDDLVQGNWKTCSGYDNAAQQLLILVAPPEASRQNTQARSHNISLVSQVQKWHHNLSSV